MSERKELPTTGERAERCGTCRFWDQWEADPDDETTYSDNLVGNCRRYPPVFIGDHEANILPEERWIQPVVAGDEWCGEWRAKPEQITTEG